VVLIILLACGKLLGVDRVTYFDLPKGIDDQKLGSEGKYG